MDIRAGIVETATNPWGQTVPIHIAFFLIWVSAIAGLAFLMVHAIYVQFIAAKQAHAEPVSSELAAKVPENVARHSLAARLFHWIMAVAMLALLITAFLPKVGYQFPWVTVHWIAGFWLTVAIIFHIFHASFWMDFWSIWPDKIDIQDAKRRWLRATGQTAPAPRKFAKYPMENKMYHLIIVLAGDLDGRVHDEARAGSVAHPESVPVQRHDVGPDVRAARPGGRGIDRTDHGSHLLCAAAREARDYQVHGGRHHPARVLSGTPRSRALGRD
jgi:hypothetical protein